MSSCGSPEFHADLEKMVEFGGMLGEGFLMTQPESPKDRVILGFKKEDIIIEDIHEDSQLLADDCLIDAEKVPYWSQPSSPLSLPGAEEDRFIDGSQTTNDEYTAHYMRYDATLPENIMAEPYPSGSIEAQGSHSNGHEIMQDLFHYSSMSFSFDKEANSEPAPSEIKDSSRSQNCECMNILSVTTSQPAGILASGPSMNQSISALKDGEEAAKKEPKSQPSLKSKRQSSNSRQPLGSVISQSSSSKTPAKKRGRGRPRSTPKAIVPQEHDYSRQPQKRKAEKNPTGATKKTKLSREQHNENERRRRAEQKKLLEGMQSALLKLGQDAGDKKLHHNNSLDLAASKVVSLLIEGQDVDIDIKKASAQLAKLQDYLKRNV